jgi:hypothetical protein
MLRDDVEALLVIKTMQIAVFEPTSVEGEGELLLVVLCEGGRGHLESRDWERQQFRESKLSP